MADIDVLDLPERNPLFSGSIDEGNMDAVGDTSTGIWGALSDLTTGLGSLIGTGFDVYGDVKDSQSALKTPENALSQQQLILLGIGAIVLIVLLTRR